MATTYKYNPVNKAIEVDNWDENDPVNFEKIYQFFKNNPIPDEDAPQVYGGNPFELNEDNAQDWSAKNGTATITADSVEKKYNNYCTKIEVTGVNEVEGDITQIEVISNTYIRVYTPNAAAFNQYDEVYISGTENFDGFYRVNAVSTTYLYLYTTTITKDLTIVETPVGAKIRKGFTVAFNENDTFQDYPGYYVIYIAHCNRLRFSIKSSNTDAKLKGIVIRSSLIYSQSKQESYFYSGDI